MAGPSEIWHLGYHIGGTVGLRVLYGRERAIEAACGILDGGGEILHLGPPDQPGVIGADEIGRSRRPRRRDT